MEATAGAVGSRWSSAAAELWWDPSSLRHGSVASSGGQGRGSWAQEEEGSRTRGAGGRASAGQAQEDGMARAEKKQAPVSGR